MYKICKIFVTVPPCMNISTILKLFVQIQGLTHTYILSDLKVDVHEIIYEISILFCRLFPQHILCFKRFFLLQSFFEVKLDVNSLKFRKRLIFFLSKYLCFHFLFYCVVQKDRCMAIIPNV